MNRLHENTNEMNVHHVFVTVNAKFVLKQMSQKWYDIKQIYQKEKIFWPNFYLFHDYSIIFLDRNH